MAAPWGWYLNKEIRKRMLTEMDPSDNCLVASSKRYMIIEIWNRHGHWQKSLVASGNKYPHRDDDLEREEHVVDYEVETDEQNIKDHIQCLKIRLT